jgi:hypothetical protein
VKQAHGPLPPSLGGARYAPLSEEARVVLREMTALLDAAAESGAPLFKPDVTLAVFTDASTTYGWGVHVPALNLSDGGEWTLEEKLLHINVLEVLAVQRFLERHAHRVAGCPLILYCDNVTAVAHITAGGGFAPTLTGRAEPIWRLAVAHGI